MKELKQGSIFRLMNAVRPEVSDQQQLSFKCGKSREETTIGSI
jgi:hypothetical protein